MKDKILAIIKRLEAKHLNDPSKTIEMDELTALISKDETETINMLNTLDIENLLWLSSDFAELAYIFRSKDFMTCLNQLNEKYPNRMYYEIKHANEVYAEMMEEG